MSSYILDWVLFWMYDLQIFSQWWYEQEFMLMCPVYQAFSSVSVSVTLRGIFQHKRVKMYPRVPFFKPMADLVRWHQWKSWPNPWAQGSRVQVRVCRRVRTAWSPAHTALRCLFTYSRWLCVRVCLRALCSVPGPRVPQLRSAARHPLRTALWSALLPGGLRLPTALRLLESLPSFSSLHFISMWTLTRFVSFHKTTCLGFDCVCIELGNQFEKNWHFLDNNCASPLPKDYFSLTSSLFQ